MRYALIVALATLVSFPLGLVLGQLWLLPILNAAPAYLIMVKLLRRGQRRGAIVTMIVWAAALALFGSITFSLWPSSPGGLIVNGPEYRDEMFQWIRLGVGAEGSLRLFLPRQLLHLAAFVLLSVITASVLSILMGVVLMNYMAFYVASLAREGAPLWAVVLLGWQPWALCRIAAFCTLGVVLAEPLLSRLRPYPYAGLRSARPYLLWAAAGILADWVLKAILAPTWGHWLRGVVP